MKKQCNCVKQRDKEIISLLKQSRDFYKKHKKKIDNIQNFPLTFSDGVISACDDFIYLIDNQENVQS